MHHTTAVSRKLGVRGRSEAAAWATRTGLLDRRAEIDATDDART
jgi:hypothetical protein